MLHDYSNPEIVVPLGGSIGTPLRLFDDLLFDADASQKTLNRYVISVPDNRHFAGAVFPSWKTVWYVGRIVRETDTNDCYETYGGVSETDGRLKYKSQIAFKRAKPWKPSEEYDAFLEKLSMLSGTAKTDLMAIDMSMRVKRARFSDPEMSVTTEEGRSFVFINYFDESCNPGDNPIGQFLEITRTEDPLQQHFEEPQPKYAGTQCEFCRAYGVGVKLGFCGGCKSVRYCSKEHQKADWKKHKIVCCSVNK